MSSPESAAPNTPADLALEAERALVHVNQVLDSGRVAEVSDEAAQQLLLAAVRLFAAKRDLGTHLEAFPSGSVTATDVAVTAVAMTQAVNLELFELALWNGWSNI